MQESKNNIETIAQTLKRVCRAPVPLEIVNHVIDSYQFTQGGRSSNYVKNTARVWTNMYRYQNESDPEKSEEYWKKAVDNMSLLVQDDHGEQLNDATPNDDEQDPSNLGEALMLLSDLAIVYETFMLLLDELVEKPESFNALVQAKEPFSVVIDNCLVYFSMPFEKTSNVKTYIVVNPTVFDNGVAGFDSFEIRYYKNDELKQFTMPCTFRAQP